MASQRRLVGLCGASCLALKSSIFSCSGKNHFGDFIPFGSRFDMHLPYLIVEICSQRAHKKREKREKGQFSRLDVHLPYLIVEICSQRSHKKCEKREKGQCYYPFPHSCFKVVPDSFNLSLGLRMKCSAEGQMSSHSFLKTFPEF